MINTFLKNYRTKGTLEHFVLFEAVIYLLYYNFIFSLRFRLFFHSFKVVIVHCNTSDKIEPQHIHRLRRNLVGMCTFFNIPSIFIYFRLQVNVVSEEEKGSLSCDSSIWTLYPNLFKVQLIRKRPMPSFNRILLVRRPEWKRVARYKAKRKTTL